MSTFLTDILDDVFSGVLSDLGFTGSCTYSVVSSSYSATTGLTTNTVTATATVKAVIYEAKDSLERLSSLIREQRDEVVEGVSVQLKATVAAKPLIDASITPKVNDTLTQGSSVYTIAAIESDPAQAQYTFTLRQP